MVLIEAVVDSVKGNFILDTGAPCLILNSYYFWDYKIDHQQVSQDINGEKNVVKITHVEEFRIDKLHYQHLEAHLVDLNTIEELRGIRILGAIGLNLLTQLELEIDLPDMFLTVHKTDRRGQRLDGSSFEQKRVHYDFPFEIKGDLMLLKANIGGHSLNFCFDTGAEAVVLDNKLPADVYSLINLNRCTRLTGANGSSVPVHIGELPLLNVGCPLTSLPVVITDLNSLRRSYGEYIDGIVGFHLMTRGVVNVNFVKRRIQLSLSEPTTN